MTSLKNLVDDFWRNFQKGELQKTEEDLREIIANRRKLADGRLTFKPVHGWNPGILTEKILKEHYKVTDVQVEKIVGTACEDQVGNYYSDWTPKGEHPGIFSELTDFVKSKKMRTLQLAGNIGSYKYFVYDGHSRTSLANMIGLGTVPAYLI